MDAIAPIPSPQLLEEYSKFFRLLLRLHLSQRSPGMFIP